MKKSVKEQLEKRAVAPYPNAGWQSEFVVPVSVAMRIVRRACKEAYERGFGDACDWKPTPPVSKVVSDIINGPKKAREK